MTGEGAGRAGVVIVAVLRDPGQMRLTGPTFGIFFHGDVFADDSNAQGPDIASRNWK